MKYRTTTILPAQDLVAAAATRVIDIKIKDIISRISIYWQVTLSGEGMDSYQHKDISRIELVDGSDVLFSVDGGQAQALCIYDRKIPTMNYRQRYDGNSMACNFGIDFGRFLHDPLLALDPKRFDNLQLKITYNEAVASTGATVNEMEIIADVFDEKQVSPIGFLSAKEIYNATPPASGYTYIELPTDHTLRKLLLQGYYKDNTPYSILTEFRLDEDNDKRVLFDWNAERYYRMKQAEWTPVEDLFVCLTNGQTGRTFYVTPTDYYGLAHVTGADKTESKYSVDAWQSGGKVVIYSATEGRYANVSVKGYLPNHCFELPMGDPKDIEDWYDLANVGSLRLRLKSGGANGNYGIVTQQLRRY